MVRVALIALSDRLVGCCAALLCFSFALHASHLFQTNPPPSIHRFEEGYKTEHGRLPRGAEKAALASTYAQYRAWKRLVKEDAARYVWDLCGV